jgi:serine protease
MNISIGGTSSSTTLRDALNYAVGRGAFIAISMGNSYESGNPVIYPASYAPSINGVMSVASINKAEGKAYYSSTGSYCEVAAPGGDSRQGSGTTDRGLIWQSTLLSSDMSPGAFGVIVPRFDRYDKAGYQGTSMASPHVAGLAALLMSQIPGATPSQVEQIIRLTAKDLGSSGRDDFFGYGLIQPRTALFGQGIRK